MSIYTDLSTVRALPGLSDETDYPDALLTDCIARAEELILDYCGPWGVHTITLTLPGGSGSILSSGIPAIRSIVSCSYDSVAQTTTDWTFDFYGDIVTDVAAVGVGTIVLTVTAGFQDTPPERLQWAAAVLAKSYAVEHDNSTPERALAVQSEFGQIQLAQAGGQPDRPTAYPDVNAVLNRFRKGPYLA